MAKYEVTYIITEAKTMTIEADSFDEAKSKWEDDESVWYSSGEPELFLIEDEDGNQVVY